MKIKIRTWLSKFRSCSAWQENDTFGKWNSIRGMVDGCVKIVHTMPYLQATDREVDTGRDVIRLYIYKNLRNAHSCVTDPLLIQICS